MAHKEPVIGNILCLGAVDAHDLYFQPHTRDKPLGADIVRNLFHALGEALTGLLPLAHVVPPYACAVPACVNAEILAACLRSGVNKGIFLFRSRVAPKAVHIVVEDDGKAFVILVFAAYHSAVAGKLSHAAVKAVGNTHSRRNGGEPVPCFKGLEPVGLLLVGAAESKVHMS